MVKYFILILWVLFFNISLGQNNDSIQYIGRGIVEQKPIFLGSIDSFVQKHIVYPEKAKEDSIEGTVFISFWVDTTGNTVNHKVIRGIREDLNQEAIRVTKLIKFKEPAMQRNKPIKVRYTVPVEFKFLNEKNKINGCKKD